MKRFILTIAIIIFVGFAFANPIDPVLAKEMAKDATQKLHVLVFFKDKPTPEKVMEELGIRGNVDSVKEVIHAYKSKLEPKLFWFAQSMKRDSEIVNLCVHEILHAVSLKASPKAIEEIAQNADVEKIVPFTTEATKPDDFFLKNQYYQFKEAKVTYTEETSEKEASFAPVAAESREITPDQIINILKQVFAFIKENQPVVNISVDQASAVPQGTSNWQQLAGWIEKHTGQYTIEYVNLYGITVVKIVLRVHFYYNGNYNGVGKYITCATASIDDLKVLWGYTLNADVKVPSSGIVNIGTHDNPVAGMKMFVHWAVHTIIQHQEGTKTYSLDGKGNVSSY